MEKIETVKHQCNYCSKEFMKESSLLVHLCEPKRRHQERTEVGVQIGLQAYLKFYEISQGSAKFKSFDDFVTSPYYKAFVKFGRHCQSIQAINIPRFTEWLIRNNKKIDHWCRDSVYTEYLLKHVLEENSMDAVSRAIETSIKWQETHGCPAHDYLRYGNKNAISYAITSGKVTGWVLFNCESGQDLLASLNQEQLALIWPWVDPDVWSKKLHDYPADAEYVKSVLKEGGW